jgi:hypothetical protein
MELVPVVGADRDDPETSDRVLRLEQNARAAFGTDSFARERFNRFLGLAGMDSPAKLTQQGVADIESLNVETETTIRRINEGKMAEDAIKRMIRTLPTPASFTSRSRAASQVKAAISTMDTELEKIQRQLNAADRGVISLTANTRETLEMSAISAAVSRRSYQAILDGLEGRQQSATEIDAQLNREQRIRELQQMGESPVDGPGRGRGAR